MVTIRYVLTDQLTWEKAQRLPFLRAEDIDRADRYKRTQDKILHLVSAYLKRKYVGEWETTAHGKPVSASVCFNVSHTDGLVAIALSDESVGLDVERVRPVEDELRAYIASPEEKEKILTDEDFFSVWTAKESLAKAEGAGLIEKPERIPAFPLCGEKNYRKQTFYSATSALQGYIFSVTRKGNEPFLLTPEREELPE